MDTLKFLLFKSSSNSSFTTVRMTMICTNLEKNGLGNILGHFLKNSSGHPGRKLRPKPAEVKIAQVFDFFLFLLRLSA
jgi:hypothetical protein